MNRLQHLDYYLTGLNHGRELGGLAALHNEGWDSNRYPVGSDEWIAFGQEHNATLERLAESEGALRAGRISAGESSLDAGERQPVGFVGFILSLIGVK